MVLTIAILIWFGSAIESRHLTGDNMAPTLNIDDRVLFNTSTYWQGKAFRRGDIILFFPPTVRVVAGELDHSFLAVMDRASAPPSLKYPQSSVKRVIGLPGDKIEVRRQKGVFVNGQLLSEPYIKEQPDYDLHSLKDMGGLLQSESRTIQPYPGRDESIIVPPKSLFVLGDNRNKSEDSHIFGFVSQKRVVGQAVLIYYPRLEVVKGE